MKQQPDESDESVSDAASVCQDGANARRESYRSHRVISSHRHIPRLWPSGTSTGVLRHHGYCQISQVTGCGFERWDDAKHGAQWCPVGVQGLVRVLVSNGLQDKFLRFPKPKSHRLCCFCTKDLKQDLNRVGMDQESCQDSKFNTCQYVLLQNVSIRKMCQSRNKTWTHKLINANHVWGRGRRQRTEFPGHDQWSGPDRFEHSITGWVKI